jgi:hypothetical protein
VCSLLRMGACAVIAPTWTVEDRIAHAVAQEFYSALLTDPKRPFADILRQIRSRAYTAPGSEDSSPIRVNSSLPAAPMVPAIAQFVSASASAWRAGFRYGWRRVLVVEAAVHL